MLSGPERIAEYMKRSRLRQNALADILGLHLSTFNKIVHGHRRPSLAIAVRIEDETGIPVASWVATKRSSLDRDRSAKAKTRRVA